MAGLARQYDASVPPGRPYPGCTAVAGYLGGNTPHVWTAAEWNAASDNGRLLLLPIWVGFGEADPVDHAKQAAAAAIRLGWTPHHAPTWRAVVLDVENVPEREWILTFGGTLRTAGFLCWPYMSLDVLPSDPPGYQVWAADWNGIDDVPAIHDVILHQYAHDLPWLSTTVDLSAVAPNVLVSYGRGPRHG